MLKNLFLKKDSGDVVGNCLSMVLMLMFSMIIIWLGIFLVQYSITRSQIASITRNGILQMEESGYLDTATSTRLRTAVMGMSGVSACTVEGTTSASRNSSNSIYLKISARITPEWVGHNEGDGTWFTRAVAQDVTVQYNSTAVGYQ